MPIRTTIVSLTVALSLVFAASAQAYVYWGDPHAGTIGRANNDGSDATDAFIHTGGEPFAIAVDASHIYWANEAGSIGRANIDGTEVRPNFIPGLGEPTGVAITPSFIFWSDLETDKIGRANLDGSGSTPGFISTDSTPCGVAVAGGDVYWTNSIGFEVFVGRATLGGGSPDKTFGLLEENVICGLAVNTANIFWAGTAINARGKTIGRVNTSNGEEPNHGLIGEADGPCGVTVSGLQLYWANTGNGTIGRANTDGTVVDEDAVQTGGGEICGVAVDSLSTPFDPPPPSPPSSGPSPPPPPLGGKLKVAGVKYDKKNGSARVSLKVNEAGTVSLSGKGVGAAKVKARGAETVALSVLAAKSKRPTLRRTGKLVTKVRVSFTPSDGGASATLAKGLTLREQTPHRK
ncbi:MAG TPA: hypothetical protein VH299_02275 [Solirubrobacterales bacterium]|jgi:hypothetical protein|nr:hypothetical protein [Solirubrobacterales bacterium]